MKRILLSAALFFSCSVAFTQEKKVVENPKSNIETLSEKAGSFSKKEIIPIGKTGGITVEVIRLLELSSKQTSVGVKLSGRYQASYGAVDKAAFLDQDEIDGFLKTFDYIKEKVIPSDLPENSTEYNFYSRGGFSSGIFKNKKKWLCYVDLEKYGSNSFFSLEPAEYIVLADLITQAKAKF